MTVDEPTSDSGGNPGSKATKGDQDRALQARFERLGEALSKSKLESEAQDFGYQEVENRGEVWSKSLRYATDFIAGIAVGGFLGFGIDWLLSSSPIGLFVGVMLGFGAGTLNILRADKKVRLTEMESLTEDSEDVLKTETKTGQERR